MDAVAVQLSLPLIVLFKSLLSTLFEVLPDFPLEDHCTTAVSNPFLLLLALAALLGPPLAQTLSDRILDYLRQEEQDGSLYSEGLEGAIMDYHRVLELRPDTPGEQPKGLIVVGEVLQWLRLVTFE